MQIPSGWRLLDDRRRPLRAAHLRLRRPDGRSVEWSSWHHRKGVGLLDAATRRPLEPAPAGARRRNLSIAALFAVGSICFALGSVPPLAQALRNDAAWLFFAGSILFTSASYLQFNEASNAGPDIEGLRRTHRVVRLRAENIGWWAASIQLVGTVAFNVSTFAATRDLSETREVTLIWAPDVVGSICFLAASALALAEICPRIWCWQPSSLLWWLAAVNMAGSVAFGVSAVAARIVPTTGDVANVSLVNSTTFVGAVLFLIGSILLPLAVSAGGSDSQRAESAAGSG